MVAMNSVLSKASMERLPMTGTPNNPMPMPMIRLAWTKPTMM